MKRGFTLVEIVTVLAIIGVGMGLFYSVFFLNWSSFDKQLTLVDLGQAADRIIETISFDGRVVSQIDVAADNKSATLTFLNGDTVTYSLTAGGQIQRDGVILSENIDFSNSSFQGQGNSLIVDLLLVDDVFGQGVQLRVSTQVFPRNHV